jgi:hypothetical protein
MALTPKQTEIVNIYADLAVTNGRYPSRSELIGAGVSRDRVRDHFGTMSELRNAAIKALPEKLKSVDKKKDPHPLSDFTKEGLGTIIKENDYQDGIFIITAAAPVTSLDYNEDQLIAAKNGKDVIGHNLHKPAFNAVQNFMKRNGAELVILPMPAHVKPLHEQPRHYDPDLLPFQDSFATEFTFNNHLKAIEAHINPQQINPLTGLKRLRVHKYRAVDGGTGAEITRFKTSIIVAHAKQMMDVVPTGNESHPRIIHSTGCITKPAYLRNRIGMIANEDHKLGALVVEIEGGVFHLRQVQMDPIDGSFVDLGKRYHADGRVTEERAEAFKMGDLHPGHHESDAIKAMFKLWDIIKPKRIFFEDFFDGTSISHHLERKKLTRAKLPEYFRDLPTEISMAREVLEEIWEKAPKDAELIATASNHPEHVQRYLDEGRYINDIAENYKIAHRMIVMDLDGKNALQEFLDPEKRMNWTHENQDYFVEGVQMNVHGHLGIGGARGSKVGHETAHGDAMVAHSHTPSIYHNTFTVGHMTKERHGYNNGAQTWILCSGAVYKGGQKQLYMIIKGKFQRDARKKKRRG